MFIRILDNEDGCHYYINTDTICWMKFNKRRMRDYTGELCKYGEIGMCDGKIFKVSEIGYNNLKSALGLES